MPDIRLDSIMKKYGETVALKRVDLHARDGEFLTLVGPSGCGKSTLLRIIAGLEEQSEGDVLIGGKNVNQCRPSKRDLAMVFQSYALYPHLTNYHNMLTPLRLRDLNFWERMPFIGPLVPGRRPKMEKMDTAVQETARTLKLEHLLHRKPGQLSGGQRQRVALGRAMVRKPVAFLMDEPLSNLDAALRVHMRTELAELHRTLGTTFIYVTHDQAEALTMSDRLAVMMDGEIIQLGAPSDVYNNPRDRRVAEFIGSPKINLLPGEVNDRGKVTVMGGDTGIRLKDPQQKVRIGIRPEHFSLANGNASPGDWQFVVTHKENLGADFYLHGHLNGYEERVITRAKSEDVASIALGATVKLKAAAGAPMVFGEDDARLDPVSEEAHELA